MKDYHLVFASDVHYLPYTMVAIQSVIDALDPLRGSSSDRDRLIFTILIDDTVDMADFTGRCESFDERNSHAPARIEIRPTLVDRSLFAGFSTWGKHHTHSAFYRLLIDRILPSEVSRALYLDVDMLILADVRELFDSVNLDDKYLAVVKDYLFYCGASQPSIKPKSPLIPEVELDRSKYFNSGLILFNLDLWRRDGMTEQALELSRSYDVSSSDQDVLNMLIEEPVYLHPSWNAMTAIFMVSAAEFYRHGCARSPEEFYSQFAAMDDVPFAHLCSQSKIIHFTVIKPWDRDFYLRTHHVVPMLPSEVWHFAFRWRHTADSVVEFKGELSGAYLNFGNYINYCLYHTIQNNERQNRKRKKDRAAVLYVTFVLFLISIALHFLD